MVLRYNETQIYQNLEPICHPNPSVFFYDCLSTPESDMFDFDPKRRPVRCKTADFCLAVSKLRGDFVHHNSCGVGERE
jgi:hypothetical protein